MQATKPDNEQPPIASVLEPLDPQALLDVLIVGCGPAGLYLAAQVAKKGLKVGIVGQSPPPPTHVGSGELHPCNAHPGPPLMQQWALRWLFIATVALLLGSVLQS